MRKVSSYSWLDLVISVLALWRVTSLFTDEPGPGDVFKQLRELAGIEYEYSPVEGKEVKASVPDTYVARLLDCPWCFSMMAALPYALLWRVNPELAKWLSIPYALSAGVIAINKHLDYENT